MVVEKKDQENIYVGSGLTAKTYEDCLAEGLNPNANDPGELRINKADISGHAARSIKWALKALKPLKTA